MAYDLTPASSHSISYGDADAYSPGVNTISIVFRAYVDDFSPACGFVNKRNAHNSHDEYSAGINYTGAGRWEIQLGNAAGTAVGAAYYGARTEAAGAWYHCVFVYNGGASAGSRCQIYIDGVAKSITAVTDANVTPGNTGSALVLGRVNNTGSFYFDGRLAEVALYNVALTADEAVALSQGYAPPMVRGRSPFFYDGLRGEPRDEVNGIAGTTSAPYIDHPRVILPARPVLYRVLSAGGPSTASSAASSDAAALATAATASIAASALGASAGATATASGAAIADSVLSADGAATATAEGAEVSIGYESGAMDAAAGAAATGATASIASAAMSAAAGAQATAATESTAGGNLSAEAGATATAVGADAETEQPAATRHDGWLPRGALERQRKAADEEAEVLDLTVIAPHVLAALQAGRAASRMTGMRARARAYAQQRAA